MHSSGYDSPLQAVALFVGLFVVGGLIACGSTGPDGGGSDDSPDDGSGSATAAKVFFNQSPTDCSLTKIRRLKVGTDSVEDVFTESSLGIRDLSVDPDAGRVFYTFDGTVRRVNTDGTGAQTLYTASGLTPNGIAADLMNDQLFWVESNGCSPCPSCGQCSQLVRADLTGSNPDTLRVISGTRNPGNVAVDPDGGRAYWADIQYSPYIVSIQADGTDTTNVLPQSSAGGVRDLEIDRQNDKIYWLAQGGGTSDPGTIKRANLDGTNVDSLLSVGGSSATFPRGLAINADAGKMYWTESGFCNDAASGRLRRANLDGSNVETVLDGLPLLGGVEVVPSS